DAMTEVMPRFSLIAGGSGVRPPSDARLAYRRQRAIDELRHHADIVLIDCGAGVHPEVLAHTELADRVLVVTTPEPTSVTDAYALIKLLTRAGQDRPTALSLALLINQAIDHREAHDLHQRIASVCRQFLRFELPLAGAVRKDESIPAAVYARAPVVNRSPRSFAAADLRTLASHEASLLISETTKNTKQTPGSTSHSNGLARFVRSCGRKLGPLAFLVEPGHSAGR
ncbi:MAG: cellulose synthase operon protein YhjQ/BcsQ, partial [Planctomycetota bacterium]